MKSPFLQNLEVVQGNNEVILEDKWEVTSEELGNKDRFSFPRGMRSPASPNRWKELNAQGNLGQAPLPTMQTPLTSCVNCLFAPMLNSALLSVSHQTRTTLYPFQLATALFLF